MKKLVIGILFCLTAGLALAEDGATNKVPLAVQYQKALEEVRTAWWRCTTWPKYNSCRLLDYWLGELERIRKLLYK